MVVVVSAVSLAFRCARARAGQRHLLFWNHIAPDIDWAVERLPTKERNAALLCGFLNHDFASAAKILRTSELRVEKRLGRGMKKLAKRLGKRRGPVDPRALASACATEGCAATVPEGLSIDILQAVVASQGQRPSLKLARRTLSSLAWARWLRRCVISPLAFGVLLAPELPLQRRQHEMIATLVSALNRCFY